MNKRIGLFGGSFDPLHVGHVVLASIAREQLDLDLVMLVVANDPWQKADVRVLAPAEARYEMVKGALAELRDETLMASRMEIDRGGVTYTADTVAQVSDENPGAELFLIVGADVAAALDTWERIEEVRSRVTLAVGNRPTPPPETVLRRLRIQGWKVEEVRLPPIGVSSSEVRARLASGQVVHGILPPSVERYIQKAGLYASGPRSGVTSQQMSVARFPEDGQEGHRTWH